MASSPAKRRKLSAEPPDKSSEPTPHEATKDSINRPSFASPTKASVVRHNTELLTKAAFTGIASRRKSVQENESEPIPMEPLSIAQSNAKDIGQNGSGSQNQRAIVAEGDNERRPEAEPLAPAQPSGQIEQSNGHGLSAPPRRRSRTPGKEVPKAPDTVRAGQPAESGQVEQLAHQAQVEPPAPSLTPIQEPSIASQGITSSHPTRPQALEVPTEPELPLTPVQRGLTDPVVTTPPSGIHNTPSKRPKRKVRRSRLSALRPQKGDTTRPEILEDTSKLDSLRQQHESLEDAGRPLSPIDPYAEKNKIKDQILQELQELQADVALAEKETERHRRYYLSGKGPAEAPNPEDLINLIGRTVDKLVPRTRPPKPPSLFNSISSFLPFARRPRRPPAEPPKETPIPSHLPVAVDDQLPYLQAFTPLTLESVITLLPSKSSTAPSPLLQSHDISLAAPSGLFSARINLTVDTEHLSITSLSLTSLETAAESELGHWARQRASGKSVLGRDINAICWAMARWYELAVKRARFWFLAEREFGNEDGRRRAAERLRTAASRKRKRKRKSTTVAEADEESGDEEAEEGGSGERKWTRKELLPGMKRTSLVLGNGRVELTIGWRIVFDWTGEAESDISASARLPESWQETDERGSLAKVSETFDHLVKSRGPMAAVRAIVVLLMPS